MSESETPEASKIMSSRWILELIDQILKKNLTIIDTEIALSF